MLSVITSLGAKGFLVKTRLGLEYLFYRHCALPAENTRLFFFLLQARYTSIRKPKKKCSRIRLSSFICLVRVSDGSLLSAQQGPSDLNLSYFHLAAPLAACHKPPDSDLHSFASLHCVCLESGATFHLLCCLPTYLPTYLPPTKTYVGTLHTARFLLLICTWQKRLTTSITSYRRRQPASQRPVPCDRYIPKSAKSSQEPPEFTKTFSTFLQIALPHISRSLLFQPIWQETNGAVSPLKEVC